MCVRVCIVQVCVSVCKSLSACIVCVVCIVSVGLQVSDATGRSVYITLKSSLLCKCFFVLALTAGPVPGDCIYGRKMGGKRKKERKKNECETRLERKEL